MKRRGFVKGLLGTAASVAAMDPSKLFARTLYFGPNFKFYDAINTGFGSSPSMKPSNWTDFIQAVQVTPAPAGAYQFTFPSGTGELPSDASVTSLATTIKALGIECIGIDIESWPVLYTSTTQAERQSARDKVIHVLDLWKQTDSNTPIGWYGMCPHGAPHASIIAATDNAAFLSWQAANDDANFLSHADQVQPVLYAPKYEASPYTDTLLHWERMLQECERVRASSTQDINPWIQDAYPPNSTQVYSIDISGATKDSQCQLTVAANSFITGDTVRVSSVSGMTQINGVESRINVDDATHITLLDCDSTSFSNYTSGGEVTALLRYDLYCELLLLMYQYTDQCQQWGYFPTMKAWNNGAPWWRAIRHFKQGLIR